MPQSWLVALFLQAHAKGYQRHDGCSANHNPDCSQQHPSLAAAQVIDDQADKISKAHAFSISVSLLLRRCLGQLAAATALVINSAIHARFSGFIEVIVRTKTKETFNGVPDAREEAGL